MYIIPLIRTQRAIAACSIYPQHPLQAIAISEILSLTLPFIKNSTFNTDILVFMFYFFYSNEHALHLIEQYKQKDILFYKYENISLFIYLLAYFSYYFLY